MPCVVHGQPDCRWTSSPEMFVHKDNVRAIHGDKKPDDRTLPIRKLIGHP